ncbi:hypothetical protein CTEN210_14892 [Chaetoceros tenuissimus]|uniref:HRDC domain-containing protein n=1 Tax=Chaetoceros tenuissimus TaxID=426638 RepID=A0AAD3D834_9STRA|nr:hypothetical protein CTEN210_14892 [Chaetoceros tenuissimus]
MATPEMEVDAKLRKVLERWRRAQARRDKVQFSRVLTDAALDELSTKKPVCEPDILALKSMSQTKFRKYGSKISDVIRKYKVSTATSTVAALKLRKEKIPQYLRIQSALLGWRLCEASKRERSETGILKGSTLRLIAAQAPTTISSLANVKGVGQAFLRRNGNDIIRIIQCHLSMLPIDSDCDDTVSSQEDDTIQNVVRSSPRRSARLHPQNSDENTESNNSLSESNNVPSQVTPIQITRMSLRSNTASSQDTTRRTIRSSPRRSQRLQGNPENSEQNSRLSASGDAPSQVTPIQTARQSLRNNTTSSQDTTRQTVRTSPRRSTRLHTQNSSNSSSSSNRLASDNTPSQVTPIQAARISPRRSRRLQVQNAVDESDDSDEVIYIETRTSPQTNVLDFDNEIVIVEDLNNSDVISRRIQDAENSGNIVHIF